MTQKKKYKYDAFISYRHSDLDSFVAETLHKELEKFRLPKNLVKLRGEGEKTKIERVFRDRDELPIAANLSENIMDALTVSEFLIVICTPRLKESMWCKSEIDNFIALNGRERVLAVLAEGEPIESFPEQIVKVEKTVVNERGESVTEVVDIEPLAADVRGSNRNEIKKKIKAEVMRLAAAIFACNYDEIKQRHREQVLKRRIKIAVGVTAVSLVVGGFSAYQALTISKQRNKIEDQVKEIQSQYDVIADQYNEIEAAYSENYTRQSEIVLNQVQAYLDAGKVSAAKALLVEAHAAAPEKMSEVAENNLKYAAAETLRVYDNATHLKPLRNLFMDSRINNIGLSSDFKYIMAFDTNATLAIWNLETFEKVYEASTDYRGEDEFGQDYYFNSKECFYYLGANSMNKIDCATGEVLWHTEIHDAKRLISCTNDELVVVAGDAAYLVDKMSGEILRSKKFGADEVIKSADKLVISSDAKSVYAFVDLNDKMCIYKISTKDMSIEKKQDIKAKSVLAAVNTYNGNIVWESYYYELDFDSSNFGYDSMSYAYHCFDENTMEEKWVKETDHFMTDLIMYNDSVLGYYSGGIMMMNPDDFSVSMSSQIPREIKDIAVSNTGILKLFLSDGTYLVQNAGSFSFFIQGDYEIALSNLITYKNAGKYIAALPRRSNQIVLYDFSVSNSANELDEEAASKIEEKIDCYINRTYHPTEGLRADVLDDGIAIYDDDKELKKFNVSTNAISGVHYDEKANCLIVAYSDSGIEIRSAEDYSLLVEFVTGSTCMFTNLDDERFIVGDINEACVINRNTFQIEARLCGYYSYDEGDHSFILKGNGESTGFFKVPDLGLSELMEMCKE